MLVQNPASYQLNIDALDAGLDQVLVAMGSDVRDPGYFWYLLHTGAFGLVLFTLNGYGFEYFWPNWPWLADASVPLSICLALIGMQQFSRTFLELKERWPAGNRVSVALIGFFLLLGVASVQLPYSTSTPLASDTSEPVTVLGPLSSRRVRVGSPDGTFTASFFTLRRTSVVSSCTAGILPDGSCTPSMRTHATAEPGTIDSSVRRSE